MRQGWRPSPASVVALGIAVGLAGNLATSTVHIHEGTATWLVWGVVTVLVVVAIGVEGLRRRTEPHQPDAAAGEGFSAPLAGGEKRLSAAAEYLAGQVQDYWQIQ